ncbi:MAG: hypothetical protein U5K81_12955 [Trueperaceae bacterium]|nr:hypothetical protein [Trueperaceae bacterium]
MDAAPGPAAPTSPTWTCGACGYPNEAGATCDRCGVARRWLENPPLDVPPQPGWFERPSAWLALLHGGLALLGATLLLRPDVAPWLSMVAPAQAIQVALSLGATLAAVNQAATERTFHEVALEIPERAPAGQEITADARVVPYVRTRGVNVTLELLENTYHRRQGRRGETQIQTRTRSLAKHRMVRGTTLPGRRASLFEAGFIAPFPAAGLRDVMAELQASLFGALAWLVPGFGHMARNLREHGGIWVRLTVRVGPFYRRVDRRVVVYALAGEDVHIG